AAQARALTGREPARPCPRGGPDGPGQRALTETRQGHPSGCPRRFRTTLLPVSTLGLSADAEARCLLRRALRDAWPAAQRFGWSVAQLCELGPEDGDVGYSGKDATLYVKVRDPAQGSGRFYPYGFILATLLHELTHLSFLGHGKAFYRRLVKATSLCGATPSVRQEVRRHVCGELLNAVCDNDQRRARALLAALPEAAACGPLGLARQLPLAYAAHHGRVALTRLLLEARADADACSGGGGCQVPPLAWAAAQGNKRTVRVLLDGGACRGRLAQVEPALLERLPPEPPEEAPSPGLRACAPAPPAGSLERRGASLRSRSMPLPALPGMAGGGCRAAGGGGRSAVSLSGSLAL
ncbi:unnamed protein product, partial [Prorocentrum cordatum]